MCNQARSPPSPQALPRFLIAPQMYKSSTKWSVKPTSVKNTSLQAILIGAGNIDSDDNVDALLKCKNVQLSHRTHAQVNFLC